MDYFRMILGNEKQVMEISRGTKEELLNDVKSRKDFLKIYVRILTNDGRETAYKNIGEQQIKWNLLEN